LEENSFIHLTVKQTWWPVVGRRGSYFGDRQRSEGLCTSDRGPSSSALTTVTQLSSVSLSTLMSTWFHFVVGRTSRSLTWILRIFILSKELTTINFSTGVPMLQKV